MDTVDRRAQFGALEAQSKAEEEASLRQREAAASPTHPLALIRATASVGFCAMLPVALLVETPAILRVAQASSGGTANGLLVRAVVATLTGGSLAFAMVLVELRIVQLASSLTLSVAGILKEVLTVAASALLLGDELNRSNVCGLALCIAGIAGYQCVKQDRG